VSLEDNVKGVVTNVSLGEADAGVAWVTDISAAAGAIDGVQIPDAENAISTYPIAVVKSSKNAGDAQAFVDCVLSDAGQQVLRADGFMPPSGP
jgi:molybdate transport system substrate-binding protein